jgi:hypothetical protein
MSRVAVQVLLEIKPTIVDTRLQHAMVSPVSLGIRNRRNVTLIRQQTAPMEVWVLTIIAAIPMVIVRHGVTRRLPPGSGITAILQLQRVR